MKNYKQMNHEAGDSMPSSSQPEVSDLRPMTFGEKLVGLTFNPSGDAKVNKAKQLCAELADLLNDEFRNREQSEISNVLYDHTIGEILNAQMNIVKLITLKY